MDCCRTALRLGAKNVKVMLRTPISAMLASPWEIEDTLAEGIPILENHNPAEYVVEDGKLTGMKFEMIEYAVDAMDAKPLHPPGRPKHSAALWCSWPLDRTMLFHGSKKILASSSMNAA